MAEFAGVAASMQIFGYQQIHFRAARRAWPSGFLSFAARYRQVEKIFLVACVFYLSYVVSAVLAKPDWLLAAKETVVPTVHLQCDYLLMLIGSDRHHHRAVAIFLFAGGLRGKARRRRASTSTPASDVLVGSICCMAIVFFIIVCTARHAARSRHDQHHRRGARPPRPSCRWPESGPAISLRSAC